MPGQDLELYRESLASLEELPATSPKAANDRVIDLRLIPNHWSDRYPRAIGGAYALGILATITTFSAASYEVSGGEAALTAVGALTGVAVLGAKGFVRLVTETPPPLPRGRVTKYRTEPIN